MRELARSGLAILLVTHHVSEIIPEMERVILLQDGGILADGAKERVLTEENLRTLFRTEIRLQRSDGFFLAY
jgi:iron complex transport system ATP-binding protein